MALRTATFDEPERISDVIKSECGSISRDAVTVITGSGVCKIGTVLGQITKGAASSAAKAGGNTGNGTLVLDVATPILAGAVAGVYSLRFTTTTSMRLEGPNGLVVGDIPIGGSTGNTATVNEQVKGVVTQGATPFAAGDGFDITIAAGSMKFAPYNPGATDGREIACAVLVDKLDATSADRKAVAVTRLAEVSRLGLIWHSSVDSDAKKTAGIAHLARSMVITRVSA